MGFFYVDQKIIKNNPTTAGPMSLKLFTVLILIV